MKKFLSIFVLSFFVISVVPSVAFAAKPENAGKPKPPSDGGSTSEMVGYDVSYPQCGKRLPNDHYFGIVGVNGGTAASENPCLAEQLAWANKAKDGSKQPKIQLYVNTANPAQDSIYNWASWPNSSPSGTPYGECAGERTNDKACSWQYGWNRSVETDSYFLTKAQEAGLSSVNTGSYTWWLDVETMNSWQSGSQEALERNVATLEGFTAYYKSKGANVGLYSTEYQWGVITGNHIKPDSNLIGLPNWRPSGASLSNAINNCNVDPLTSGGIILLTQYVRKNLDHNHSCI